MRKIPPIPDTLYDEIQETSLRVGVSFTEFCTQALQDAVQAHAPKAETKLPPTPKVEDIKGVEDVGIGEIAAEPPRSKK